MTGEEAIRILEINRPVITRRTNAPERRYIEAYEMATSALKNKEEWIPVSERLPEKSGRYWCTFGGTYLTGIDYYTTESDAKELFDDNWEEYTGWQSQNTIAWMPLPEPYKSEKDSE